MGIRAVGEVKVAVMGSRFDSCAAKEIETTLMKLIEAGSKKILCDFSQTEYISSAGLRVLLLVAKKLQKIAGEVILCSLKPYVSEVFETAGFTQIFKICSSEEEALKSFK